MLIISLKVNESIFYVIQLMLHVNCDFIVIAQYHFLKSKMAAMYFALYQNLKSFLVNLYWKTLETELKRF